MAKLELDAMRVAARGPAGGAGTVAEAGGSLALEDAVVAMLLAKLVVLVEGLNVVADTDPA